MSTNVEGMQIGELAERVGVSAHTLRAWERRYGILQPSRTIEGHRVYSDLDLRRVAAVLSLREQGVAIAEAARRVNVNAPTPVLNERPIDAAAIVRELHRGTESFDEFVLGSALDRLFSAHRLEDALRDALMPFLVQLGERWESGEVSVAHEHFASQLIRRRLDSYSLMWADGDGPLAVLACPPGEQHDIALLVFGVLLSRSGWRTRYLGQETPIDAVHQACGVLEPDLVVIATAQEENFRASTAEIRGLASKYRVAVAGQGATAQISLELGVQRLARDVVAGAAEVVGADMAEGAETPVEMAG